MMVANNLKDEGGGFATDTNIITIITRETVEKLPIMTKEAAANEILSRIIRLIRA